MTLEDWLAAISPDELHDRLSEFNDRKLHLLTAAFLRRVWDHLPSHHTRIAVEATEKFVDGLVTADQLAHLRSRDLLETAEFLWASSNIDFREEQIILGGWECPCCTPDLNEYENRMMMSEKGFDGVRKGVEETAWIAVQAALYARDLVAWAADTDERDESINAKANAQYDIFREIVGPGINPHWPEWRTETVRLIVRRIHREQNFSLMSILADAL